jgi:hypothetical protein
VYNTIASVAWNYTLNVKWYVFHSQKGRRIQLILYTATSSHASIFSDKTCNPTTVKSFFYLKKCALSLLSLFWNKKFWGELISYFPLIRHGLHRKRRIQQFCYFCVRIRCHGNVLTQPLPSNDNHTDTQTDGRDLWSTPMRLAQMPWYTYQVS